MNKLLATAIVSAAAFVSFGAAAQEATPTPDLDIKSTATRAEVRAEYQRAKAAGELKVYSAGYIPTVNSSRSRAEVVAELRQAQQSGEYALINAEAVDVVAFEQLAAKQQATRLATKPDTAIVR
ncbi:DUF4148 domain-containing protein [Caldimonas thermodepolymerans]|jgi:uncharacterized protein YdbL (DUF1318 family)|uniref:Uncharacterized protein DUF4148 n=1 Tax=Caldimonas thermodepolymerans TaxID=215580 RepID=A0A2S5T8R2_9BURK|nr:DUF4148 domain-containing protein [Caldimonas thermodepolymerans]PPE71258.1 hypothetical protein C1702_02220 [Caldimonas thermodepolymerans]QPC32432.1 DUF4148 domain-containing protein [Caldimonas thermodepolymerans]RDH98819.1 uncharacterized protein DUF4148 [Caldimonas thermodepolymerans]TCP06217.1 uncharacterized protein DUF4148 [Caldimonas thermodepolymerans]UZG45228.1 DUF4148 domain-containing protein [Caldimonas thermodepolymerans]